MKKLLLAVMAALLPCVSVSAQTLGTGAYALASFDDRGFDAVNLGNLNTRFTIPIVSKAGRGLSFNYAIQYEGLVWGAVASGSNTAWVPASGWGFTGVLNGTAFTGYLTHNTSYLACGYDSDPGQRSSGSGTDITTYGYVYYDGYGAAHTFSYRYDSGCSDGSTQPSTSGDTPAGDGSGYILLNGGLQIQARNGTVISPGFAPGASNTEGETDANGNQISFDGQGTFTDTTGAHVLSITGSGPLTFTYPVTLQANNATTASATLSYKVYTVRTNFSCSGINEYGSNTVNLVDHITLADGSTYSFTYEGTPGATDGAVTGRMASLTLPTGGTVGYAYNGGCSSAGGINPDGTVGNLTRTTTDGTRTYTRAPVNANATSTTLQDEKGNQTVLQFTIASGNFYETHRQVYQGSTSGSPLLDRSTCYNGATASCDGQAVTPPFTEADVTTSYNGGTQDLAKNSYDSYGNLLTTTNYASAGSVLLQTATNTYNQFSEVTGSIVTDGSGNQVSAASYGYDENAPTPTSGFPQHTSYTNYAGGNQTSSHISAGSTTLVSTTAYYDTGMPVSTTTPNGTTSFVYDSTQTFVTQTTLPTPSSGVGLSTSATYDANSGSLLTSTGMNSGQTTTVNQYDALLRPVTVTPPSGGQISYTFAPGYAQIQRTLNTSSGQRTFSSAQTDAYGRANRSATANGQSSNPYYETDICYDATGLAHFVSTPYASVGFGAAIVCQGAGTTYQYDALGRVTSVTTSDGSATTTYQNRAVQTTDVNGVQRITQYDLLGRISAVCEVSGNSLGDQTPGPCGTDIPATGYLTKYNYSYNSALATNVLTVSQGPQQRVFQSDLAGRLVSVYEPERGTTTYQYSYNGVGLQVLRKRPRANQSNASTLTTTTSQYDSLGRLASISYDDGLTPNKNYYYDAAAPGQQWSQSPSNPKGMLVATSSGSGATLTESQFSYDTSGNVTTLLQCAPSICNGSAQSSRVLGFGYDLGGNLTASFDPAAGSISYARSAAGEVTAITNNSYQDSYNPANLVSHVANTPFGPGSYAFGNGVQSVHT